MLLKPRNCPLPSPASTGRLHQEPNGTTSRNISVLYRFKKGAKPSLAWASATTHGEPPLNEEGAAALEEVPVAELAAACEEPSSATKLGAGAEDEEPPPAEELGAGAEERLDEDMQPGEQCASTYMYHCSRR